MPTKDEITRDFIINSIGESSFSLQKVTDDYICVRTPDLGLKYVIYLNEESNRVIKIELKLQLSDAAMQLGMEQLCVLANIINRNSLLVRIQIDFDDQEICIIQGIVFGDLVSSQDIVYYLLAFEASSDSIIEDSDYKLRRLLK